MSLEPVYEIISRAQIGFALMTIAFVLVLWIFRKDIKEISKKKSK